MISFEVETKNSKILIVLFVRTYYDKMNKNNKLINEIR